MTCPVCGEPCAVVLAYDDREGCAACWLSGRASSVPGSDDGSPLSSTAGEPQLQRRIWNKGSARTSGPAQAGGAVRVLGSRLVRCPKCQGYRLVGFGPLATWGPHAAHSNDRGELVDCVGALLAPAAPGLLLGATG